MYDTLSGFALLSTFDDAVPSTPPFLVELVGASAAPVVTGSGIPLGLDRSIGDPGRTDIAIVPSLLAPGGAWTAGRYPELVDWLRGVHDGGGLLCSACSGVLLIAETGLLSGRSVTIHPAYAGTFRDNFPDVALRLDQVLVATGDREEFVMSGASASWHDLVLYLVARHVGPTAAQALAKFLLLQWHTDGQGPYVPFHPPLDHGDAIVADAQEWLRLHHAGARRADVQTPFHRGDRALTDLLRAADPRRGGQAPARAHRRADRGDQLRGGLRGPGLVPAPLQADHRGQPGRVPTHAAASGLRTGAHGRGAPDRGIEEPRGAGLFRSRP